MKTIVGALLWALTAFAATPITQKTAGMEKHDGFLPYYWDAAQGKLWLQVARWDTEMLYVESLPAGVGSNEIGLDRGQPGESRVVKWRRVGTKVLLVQPNLEYRAVTENAAERKAVEESFAESILWGFEVAAEDGDQVLVDATAFLLRDAHGVAERLKETDQGSYQVDASRSAFYLPRTKNFPLNTEVETTITFTGGPGGRWLRSVTPTVTAVTVRMHQSFVQLPGPGYHAREFDPRSGYFAVSYFDYATPVGDSVVKRFAPRHRLEKNDPGAAVSDPVKPIVYYLDPAVPEPVRSALLDGARWWNQAFEAAGFRNAFRVEMLPADADPMDVRYNFIEWVHRSTRGWSMGGGVFDPRTGEIIRGHVTLGSLRVRQDYLIAEAFLAPYQPGGAVSPAMLQMSLARMRQLSAHEVGHTLGLAHNYIASAEDRASVMDYPPPLIELNAAGVPDLSNAYAKGIGEWDKVAIAWGYTDFAPGADEKAGLRKILTDAAARSLVFLTDQDARSAGSAQPQTHLWDSGKDAADELNRMMGVRAKALQRFGENNIREGQPMALLEDVLVPLYLGHRYQLEAGVKVVGGLDYRYALRGDGQLITKAVPPDEQRKALKAVLSTIQPEALTLPQRIVDLIPPRPEGYAETRELFKGRTGLTFDPVGAAESAASISVGLLLNPERATRLVQHQAEDSRQLGLSEVLDALVASTWQAKDAPGLSGRVQAAARLAALRQLMSLAVDERASGEARGLALGEVQKLKVWLAAQPKSAAGTLALQQIGMFERDPKQMSLPRPMEAPPGMPIGMACDWE